MVTIPSGVLWYQPIKLTYIYNETVPHVEVESMSNVSTTYTTTNALQLSSTYQQRIDLPKASTTHNSTWSNVVFFAEDGSMLPAWLENVGGIGSPSGTTALWWVKMAGFQTNPSTTDVTFASTTQIQQNLIYVFATTYSTTSVTSYSTTIYVGYENKNNYLFNSSSTVGCNYLYQLGVGGVDNGANVFNYYGGFEVHEIPESWLEMFIWKPDFPPNGGITITSLGGWQGYVTSYKTHVPETLEAMFFSGNNQSALVGEVEYRQAGMDAEPTDLSKSQTDNSKPIGNMAPQFLSSTRGFTAMMFNVAGYFGEWSIQSSNMDNYVSAGYAFDNTNYVMSLSILADRLVANVNYSTINLTSQSSRQTPGIPQFVVKDIPGQSGFFDFGGFSGSSVQFFWIRTREYVDLQPSAEIGALVNNITNTTISIRLTSSLGVNDA